MPRLRGTANAPMSDRMSPLVRSFSVQDRFVTVETALCLPAGLSVPIAVIARNVGDLSGRSRIGSARHLSQDLPAAQRPSDFGRSAVLPTDRHAALGTPTKLRDDVAVQNGLRVCPQYAH